ncbi:hypothetical protein N0V90_007690 [Kalmusia sp. IMI 367209]|nr:hypothetical protein N0V90_007690 [Kalmusia sp. IMI 367209]
MLTVATSWTPQLYYHAQSGSFVPVPVVGNSEDNNGGMIVYYLQCPGFQGEALTAFRAGFQMLAGDTSRRNFTGSLDAKAISYNCLGSSKPETNGIPNYNCLGGLRAQVFFPSCRNERDLDIADYNLYYFSILWGLL